MVTTNIKQLGPRELEFLIRFTSEGKNIFSIEDARRFWTKNGEATKVMHRLVHKGWLKTLEPGKYLIVPFEAGIEREWSENSFVIAGHLLKPSAIAYWSAMNYWNFSEQFSRIVFVQSTQRKRKTIKEVLGIQFRFITVTINKFFGISREWIAEKQVQITDREKTVVDMLDRPDLCGGIVLVSQALQQAISQIEWIKFLNYLDRFPNTTVIKRLGFLIEFLDLKIPDQEITIHRWLKNLSTGISPLDIGSEKKGKIIGRWRLQLNVNGF